VNFFEKTLIQLGFDSIKVSFLKSQLEEKLKVDVSFSLFFSNLSIKEIANFLNKNRNSITIKPLIVNSVGPCTLASFQQQKLWFLNKYVPYKQIYNIPIKIEMKGDISRESIRSTLEKIIDRHEALRTGFEELEELIIQKPVDRLEVELIFKDVSDLSGYQAEAALKDIEYNFSSFEFDLKESGLFKACLIKCDEGKYNLLLNFHHIIFDGYSLKLFLREFSSIFNLITKSEEFLISSTHSTYKDFSNAQRHHLSGQFLEKQVSFWKEHLEGVPQFSRFSQTSKRIENFTYFGKVETTMLKTSLSNNLIPFAKNNNVTLFTILIAAYYILLFNKTGQTDLVVGSPMSGRTNSYTVNVIGLVMNVLPLRLILNESDTLEEVLRKVNKLILTVQDHQHISFDMLMEHLNITRILDVNPLYQTLFTFREDWDLDLNLNKVETSISEIATGYTKLDLSFFVQQKQSSLELQIEYAQDLFEKHEILNLLNLYQSTLENFITNPKLVLKELIDSSQMKNISIKETACFVSENHVLPLLKDQTEREIHDLWSELLGKEEIGRNDNFFQLGGHSLLLNRMILRLKKDLGYVISIREAFTNPTIASLSEHIRISLSK
jgi:acyl carrier protein